MHTRQNVLNKWLATHLHHEAFTLTPLAGDASFRRYFRLHANNTSRIIMDAPPDKEALTPFMHIHERLHSNKIPLPAIHAANLEDGFLILDDLGDNLFLNALTKANQDELYLDAINLLPKIAACDIAGLPEFDTTHMMREMQLFHDWFLQAHLGLTLSSSEVELLQKNFDRIATRLSLQPQVFIHRDYHSRNLMLHPETKTLFVIDFQDAMRGPVTYDLVSILKDCYTQLDTECYARYLTHVHTVLPALQSWSSDQLFEEVDICGLQRHLKVLGIFCRLFLRDKKPGFLRDLPLTMSYTMSCLKRHHDFAEFATFMEDRVLEHFT